MDSLYQRLKEMDPDTFQRFCAQLLKERHPEQEIRHVEGASGDEGLDVFAGELSGKPAIWQCKAFPNGVGKSQKEQIRKSLKTALKHFSPSYWILCLSVDLDSKTSRWFEKLKKSYASKLTIGEMFATEIVNEVLHRKNLKNHFFPHASLDVNELKRLAARTGEMNVEDLERLTDLNLEDTIERWESRDSRFKYQIVFDGDMGPTALGKAPIPAGLVMSISQPGGKTVNVFARDVKSLQNDPPRFSTTFKGNGLKKYQAFVRTGITQEFEVEELGPITSKWPLMSDLTNVANTHKMILAPSPAITNRKRSVRVDFVGKNGTETVRYELMDLSPIRMGTEEFEVALSGKNVPFTISMVLSNLPKKGDAGFNVESDWVQRDPRSIKKSLDAFNLLRPSGNIHIVDLETDKSLIHAEVSFPIETPAQIGRRTFISDVMAIAERFGVNLKLPDKVSKEDFEAIYLLKQYMENGTIELDDISIVIQKSELNRDLLPQQFASGKAVFRFENVQPHSPLKLFGTDVNTGPVTVDGELEVNDLIATLQSFQEAEIGAGVKMSFKPLAPVRVSLLSGQVNSNL
jgi:hypothetical protein